MVYNTFSKTTIPLDLYMGIELLSGFVNIAAFNIIGNAHPDDIHNDSKKKFYDYYMIGTLVVSWIRFFSYFLVIQHIAKITLTLFRMIFETMYFLLITVCYLMLMTTVFCILFRDVNPDENPEFQDLW